LSPVLTVIEPDPASAAAALQGRDSRFDVIVSAQGHTKSQISVINERSTGTEYVQGNYGNHAS
jgi:hypothetical protein